MDHIDNMDIPSNKEFLTPFNNSYKVRDYNNKRLKVINQNIINEKKKKTINNKKNRA